MSGPELLAGRRVLITGASGFLGSHLTHALQRAGVEVYPFTSRTADVTDPDAVRSAVSKAQPHIVYHLAAYGTTSTQRDSGRIRAVNVGGVENVWRALEHCDARLVQCGTCAEYAPKDGALAEGDLCAPATAYAASLHEAVAYSRSRAARTGRELVVLRPFGPYGPGDRPERLIPFVIDGLLGAGRVAVTAGRQRRDFSYVGDHIAALTAAGTARLSTTGAVYNIGSGIPVSVRDVVEQIARTFGEGAVERIDFGAAPPRPDDRADRYADIAAARRDLGFVPAVALADGLRMTIVAARAARHQAVR